MNRTLVHQGVAVGRSIGSKHPHLAILNLADATAVLFRNSDRVSSFLENPLSSKSTTPLGSPCPRLPYYDASLKSAPRPETSLTAAARATLASSTLRGDPALWISALVTQLAPCTERILVRLNPREAIPELLVESLELSRKPSTSSLVTSNWGLQTVSFDPTIR